MNDHAISENAQLTSYLGVEAVEVIENDSLKFMFGERVKIVF
jgi:hypothetical protein